MSNTLNKLFIFAAGAGIGSAVTWKLLKTKYEQLAQEEIDSYKEVVARRLNETAPEVEEKQEPIEEAPIKTTGYSNLVDGLRYTTYAKTEGEGDDEHMAKPKPRVISPEEFGEEDNYDTETLTYYKDGVLTDLQNNPIEDVEGWVGKESLEHIGDYEPDSVHVRNDAMQTDFEILLDTKTYSSVVGNAEE